MWPQTPSLKSLIYLRLPWMHEARARCLSIRSTSFMWLFMAIDIFRMAVQSSIEHPRIISPLLRAIFYMLFCYCSACTRVEFKSLFISFFNVSFVLLIMFWLSQGYMPWTKSHMCITNCAIVFTVPRGGTVKLLILCFTWYKIIWVSLIAAKQY